MGAKRTKKSVWQEARERRAMEAPCERCKAPAGERCKNWMGKGMAMCGERLRARLHRKHPAVAATAEGPRQLTLLFDAPYEDPATGRTLLPGSRVRPRKGK